MSLRGEGMGFLDELKSAGTLRRIAYKYEDGSVDYLGDDKESLKINLSILV